MLLIVFIVLVIPSFIVRGCSISESKPIMIESKEQTVEDALTIDIKSEENEPFIQLYDHINGKIIELSLEQYIVGVVAAEMPASFHIEALKAQAVAARTLAVRKMREYGGQGCSKYDAEVDVCSFYGHCQAWISDEEQKKNWGSSYDEKRKKIVQAVEETRGIILRYQGSPIEVFFYSTSNGKTEDSEEVFSMNLPYYGVVDSIGEEDAPQFKGIATFSRDEFVKRFKQYYPNSKLTVKNIESQVKILSYTESGRVDEIMVGGIKLKGKDFRTIYNLNSADFNFEFSDEEVIIHTTGYGHGVGMSQVGADKMAKGGKTFIDILKHYYIGVDIETVY